LPQRTLSHLPHLSPRNRQRILQHDFRRNLRQNDDSPMSKRRRHR
uniref:DUF3362 domain-containing protein n=1 Tax=Haemonchus placei TaxID=6290 RepID=A0A0N4WC60_HAEPC